MPLSISDLVVGKRKLTIPFGDGELKLTYDPNQITAEQENLEAELISQGRRIRALAGVLANLVVEWDLLGTDKKPLPPSEEVFVSLGWPVMVYINKAIGEDFYPDPLSGLS